MDFVSMSEEDADYAIKIMNQIKLYGKPIHATSDKKNLDVGVSLFIRNLDSGVVEIFNLDYMTGNSKGYGFISYDNFDSSDAAIDAISE
ncbi:splicing factor 3B subunit 4 [Rhizophagus irregularis DAOM 181602=DAOM 197198]|nr:splicing factor 3B subunit 4 [Rhizophagus irregularis DAOM 181602=DAOM 197198]